MKVLSTFKISKGFDTWLNMCKDIEPELNKVGIKILWAGTNADETKVYDITEVNNPDEALAILGKREDITKKRVDAGVLLESQEILDAISKDYWYKK